MNEKNGNDKRNEKDKQSKKETSKGENSRRKKNIDSANRSRDRLKNEHKWMSVQMSENEDRMRRLEKTIDSLTSELDTSAPQSSKKDNAGPSSSRKDKTGGSKDKSDRPKWFGEPY